MLFGILGYVSAKHSSCAYQCHPFTFDSFYTSQITRACGAVFSFVRFVLY